jgi:hypothetical protein
MTDELGRVHTSGHNFTFGYLEVLNEIDSNVQIFPDTKGMVLVYTHCTMDSVTSPRLLSCYCTKGTVLVYILWTLRTMLLLGFTLLLGLKSGHLRVTNSKPLGCPLSLPVVTKNHASTPKAHSTQCAGKGHPSEIARCAFFGRNLHSRMPLVPTPARLKLLQACDQ